MRDGVLSRSVNGLTRLGRPRYAAPPVSPDAPLDLRRRVPRHRDSGMGTYEGYTSSGTGRSTFYPTTTARHVLSEHCSYTVCSRVVTATLPVRERGNTVQRHVAASRD